MTQVPSNELNLDQELHDLTAGAQTEQQLVSAAKAAKAAIDSVEASAASSSPTASSLPPGLVEAVMQDHGFTREKAEAELIAFGA